MNSYDLGDPVIIRAGFTDQETVAVDPGQVIALVKSPSGVITTYTYGVGPSVVRVSQGNYRLTILPDAPGRWIYRWEGNVSNRGAEEASFYVEHSAFPES